VPDTKQRAQARGLSEPFAFCYDRTVMSTTEKEIKRLKEELERAREATYTFSSPMLTMLIGLAIVHTTRATLPPEVRAEIKTISDQLASVIKQDIAVREQRAKERLEYLEKEKQRLEEQMGKDRQKPVSDRESLRLRLFGAGPLRRCRSFLARLFNGLALGIFLLIHPFSAAGGDAKNVYRRPDQCRLALDFHLDHLSQLTFNRRNIECSIGALKNGCLLSEQQYVSLVAAEPVQITVAYGLNHSWLIAGVRHFEFEHIHDRSFTVKAGKDGLKHNSVSAFKHLGELGAVKDPIKLSSILDFGCRYFFKRVYAVHDVLVSPACVARDFQRTEIWKARVTGETDKGWTALKNLAYLMSLSCPSHSFAVCCNVDFAGKANHNDRRRMRVRVKHGQKKRCEQRSFTEIRVMGDDADITEDGCYWFHWSGPSCSRKLPPWPMS